MFEFDAAHFLAWHPGKCARLHGHTYKLEVSIKGQLREEGVVLDFDELARLVQELVLDRLDHTLLNDIVDNPTSERIAIFIFELLQPISPEVSSIKLWEGADSYVEVRS
ncbi:MAG: 6-carboxytetrahydropterin synthase QueD [Acidimicrobiales bacterium]